jgi:electron transfer flavoprotein alpha subunit
MISPISRTVLSQARRQLRVNGVNQSYSQIQRLLSTLAVLEQNNGVLNMGSLSAITAAKKLGGPITAIVAGGNIKSLAEEAAKAEGVEKVLSVDNSAYDRVS